jgi:O-antigen/teichoic acid export membrane protein
MPATTQSNDKRLETVRLTPPLLVARNSFLTLCSELWTLLIVFATMPIVIRALGKDVFGLFSLAWVVLGYMAMLDFGVSRAATKFVSEHLSRDQLGAVERVCRTALASNFVLGLSGGAIVYAVAPLLTSHVFHVPPQLQPEAHRILIALAVSIPILLIQAVIRAVLSAYQRFGSISLLNALALTLQWGSACIMAVRGFQVAEIVIICVSIRALATVGFAVILARIDPAFLGLRFSDFDELWRLLRFGGWVTISQLMTPIFLYLDRILIASLISVGALTIYVIPYEVITRVRVVPASLVSALFPSLSEHSGIAAKDSLIRLYSESLKYMIVILLPCFLVLAFLGSDIINAWVGPDYAEWGGRVLRIMAGGALLNSLAYVPYSALVALGRPDLPAKFHLAELPLYIALSLVLIPRWGIAGAAWAVSVRLCLDAIVLFWSATKYVGCSVAYRTLWRPVGPNLLLGFTLGILHIWPIAASLRLTCAALCLIAYSLAVWFLVLGERERPLFMRVFLTNGRTGVRTESHV